MKSKELLKDLRELSKEDLKKRALNAAEELMKLRFRNSTGQLQQSHRLSELRHEIARVKTLQKQAVGEN